MQDKLVLHEEVADALATGKPIVALETTIVTHGLPYPTNLDLTLGLSAIIREQGAGEWLTYISWYNLLLMYART